MVAEAIERLKSFPPDAIVVVNNDGPLSDDVTIEWSPYSLGLIGKKEVVIW
jgi:hypothetical protein